MQTVLGRFVTTDIHGLHRCSSSNTLCAALLVRIFCVISVSNVLVQKKGCRVENKQKRTFVSMPEHLNRHRQRRPRFRRSEYLSPLYDVESGSAPRQLLNVQELFGGSGKLTRIDSANFAHVYSTFQIDRP